MFIVDGDDIENGYENVCNRERNMQQAYSQECNSYRTLQTDAQLFVGGQFLVRSDEDYADCIPMTATVKVGESRENDRNSHEEIAEILEDAGATRIWRRNSSNAYVVRPKRDFAGD